MINTILVEVLFILCLVMLNIIIKMQVVTSNFSRYEKRFLIVTLDELICVFVGFTIFRVLTLNMASSDDRFFNNLIGLIMFQITLNVIFMVVQFNSLSKVRQIKSQIGYETKDG